MGETQEEKATAPGEQLFQVFVDDNFHYMDENERYRLGGFSTREAALEASRRIVDEFLESTYRPGLTADELWELYMMFGDNPFVVAADGTVCKFSGWDYARERCRVLCGPPTSPL
jgi:hypothetical protein